MGAWRGSETEEGLSGTSQSTVTGSSRPCPALVHITGLWGLTDALSHRFRFTDEETEAQRGCVSNRNQCDPFPALPPQALLGQDLSQAGVLADRLRWTFQTHPHLSDQSLPVSPASREDPHPTNKAHP